MLSKDYKFYFSFENSLCDDYVTEKLYANMQHDVIPIVFGGANYNNFVPPHSYINADEFETATLLAEYLLYLEVNPKEYIKYFWWREYYTVSTYSLDTFCDLCMKLRSPSGRKTQTYEDVEKWWFDGKCRKPKIKF